MDNFVYRAYVNHMDIRCMILNIATLIASDASGISPESWSRYGLLPHISCIQIVRDSNISGFWNNGSRAPDQDTHQRSTDDASRIGGDQLCISIARHMIASDASAQCPSVPIIAHQCISTSVHQGISASVHQCISASVHQ